MKKIKERKLDQSAGYWSGKERLKKVRESTMLVNFFGLLEFYYDLINV